MLSLPSFEILFSLFFYVVQTHLTILKKSFDSITQLIGLVLRIANILLDREIQQSKHLTLILGGIVQHLLGYVNKAHHGLLSPLLLQFWLHFDLSLLFYHTLIYLKVSKSRNELLLYAAEAR